MMSPSARELAIAVPFVSPDTTCAAVFDRLLAEPETRNIPVVRNGRPIGLISRKNFLLTYVRMYALSYTAEGQSRSSWRTIF